MERKSLGFPPGFAPSRYQERTPGRGRALNTGPELHLPQRNLLSVSSLSSSSLVSHEALLDAPADTGDADQCGQGHFGG